MEKLLWLIPVLPLVGFLVNGLYGRRFSERKAGTIATVLPAISFVLSVIAAMQATGGKLTQELFTWIPLVEGVSFAFRLQVDGLTGVMLLVVTGVGSLIHLYSNGYMHGDRSVSRYFAYLNLFMFAMLILIMADSLPLLFVGWEGVGLCSYLLIGFWYEDGQKADAGKKAFIVNRIGDLGFLLGMLTIFALVETLGFSGMKDGVEKLPGVISGGLFDGWARDSVLSMAALFLFVGACGKSAQIPLYVWLPDAMAGPTPVSALIHAATMVTAGVYMIGRMGFLFIDLEAARSVIAVVAGATALFAAIIAVAQNDIKKVLAYSTVSQLGYMFAGMSTAIWGVGVSHLVTHAFFKALLFLGAGTVIHMMGGEQDIRKMGGLRKKEPVVFWTFVVGWLALAGIPFLASGFYSKDMILHEVHHVAHASHSMAHWFCFFALVLGAFLTAFYMTRLVIIAFFGEPRSEVHHGHAPGWSMKIPLIVLAIFSVIGGLGISHIMKVSGGNPASDSSAALAIAISVACFLGGVGLGWLLYGAKPAFLENFFAGSALARKGRKIVEDKFYVDELYEYGVVAPLKVGAWGLWFVADRILIDTFLVHGVGTLARAGAAGLKKLHRGTLAASTAGILAGVLALLAWAAWKMLNNG